MSQPILTIGLFVISFLLSGLIAIIGWAVNRLTKSLDSAVESIDQLFLITTNSTKDIEYIIKDNESNKKKIEDAIERITGIEKNCLTCKK